MFIKTLLVYQRTRFPNVPRHKQSDKEEEAGKKLKNIAELKCLQHEVNETKVWQECSGAAAFVWQLSGDAPPVSFMPHSLACN